MPCYAGAPKRIVTIAGATEAQVAHGAQLVLAKVLEYAQTAEGLQRTGGVLPYSGAAMGAVGAEQNATVLQIPNGSEVNYIIGKGGGTIRELEMLDHPPHPPPPPHTTHPSLTHL